MALYAEGFVKYPEELPCPQVDTDIKPRERRYISDIGEVKKLRRFQSTFQAERKKISFIFTRAQAEEFRKWYKEDIIEGGAWFYADWPILHKEQRIAYRFITRPVWEFLARGVYHVTASVETYERKIGKAANVYTSKIYPYYFSEAIEMRGVTVRAMPFLAAHENIALAGASISSGTIASYIYSSYVMSDDNISNDGATIIAASLGDKFIYTTRDMQGENILLDGVTIIAGDIEEYPTISYDRAADSVQLAGAIITSGVIE